MNGQSERRTVTGTVRDGNGEPLIGVSVRISGVAGGTVTDLDGKYSIAASDGAELVFSSIGFETLYVTVGSRAIVDVVLSEDRELLDEVVVIGYGQVRKKDATGAVAVVRSSELNKVTAVSPTDQLVGKVSGLFIVPGDGTPGSGATIRIRNGSSLTATNTPMIVIDGVPVSGDANVGQSNVLAAINPNDIESYTVLKDASATAIYGSRASNGVIIITTKKGSGNRGVKVSYNSTYGVDVNTEKVPVLSPEEFRRYMDEFYPADTPTGAAAHAMMNYTYPDGTATDRFNTDWQDLMYKTAISHDHQLGINGGTQAIQYNATFGYTDQEGIILNTGLERYSFRLNLKAKLAKRLTFQTNSSFSLTEQDQTSHSQAASMNQMVRRILTTEPTLMPGDVIIVMSYALMDFEEAKRFKPSVIFPDTATNKLVR